MARCRSAESAWIIALRETEHELRVSRSAGLHRGGRPGQLPPCGQVPEPVAAGLSRRNQKLEESLGAALLERSTRHVALTMVGRDFIPKVRRFLDEFETSVLGIRDLGAGAAALSPSHCRPRSSTSCRAPSAGSARPIPASASASSMSAPTRGWRPWRAARPISASTSSVLPIRKSTSRLLPRIASSWPAP